MSKIPNPSKVKWVKSGGNAFQFRKKGDTFIGMLKGSRIIPTQFGKQTVYTFIDLKEKDVLIYGSAVLNHLQEIKKGTMVKIVFTGVVKKGKNSYKNYDIFTPEG